MLRTSIDSFHEHDITGLTATLILDFMFLLVQLLQNPFICNYFQGKKKAITAVSKKLP